MTKERYTKLIVGTLGIFIILLTLYWGTIFSIVSFQEFLKTASFSPNFIGLAFGFIGLIAWVNAIFYYKRVKKYGVLRLWRSFIIEEKKKIIFAVIATSILFLIVEYTKQATLPGYVLIILYFFSLPLQFADFVRITIEVFVSRTIPSFEFMNIFTPILHVGVQFIFFYYISKLFFREKKIKTKK